MRIGIGYDVHKIVSDRDLILGGKKIEFDNKGLFGHSDADVLLHAIMDAMLGALALGDIGKHFPDTEPKYKGISSIKLLSYVNVLIEKNGFKIGNIDSIVICEMPKLRPHIDDMRKNIAETLNADISLISVKATTTEKLGFEGRMEGISSKAVVLLMKKNDDE